FRKSPAIDRDERHFAALALLIESTRDQLLSSAGLTENENRGLGRSDRGDQAMYPGHGRRIADQDRWPLGGANSGLQSEILALEGSLLRHLAQNGFDLRQFAGLGDIIESAEPHGVDSGFHAGMPGHYDRFGIGRALFKLFEKFDAGHARHSQV